MIRRLLALAALAGVLVGGVLRLLGEVGVADAVWAASTAMMLVPLTWSVARTLWRRDVGVDAIALVAMASELVPSKSSAAAQAIREGSDAFARTRWPWPRRRSAF